LVNVNPLVVVVVHVLQSQHLGKQEHDKVPTRWHGRK
jgi:hypothetical protein